MSDDVGELRPCFSRNHRSIFAVRYQISLRRNNSPRSTLPEALSFLFIMMQPWFRNFARWGFVLLASLAAVVRAEDYAITTFAGTGSVAGSTDGQPGTFNNPFAVAIDSAKNLYVTDTVNNTI